MARLINKEKVFMGNITAHAPHLSNLQMELLKLYSTNVQENDLMEIKKFMGAYFANKAIKEADACWDEDNLSDNVMDKWLEAIFDHRLKFEHG
jgi:hypothetical protein